MADRPFSVMPDRVDLRGLAVGALVIAAAIAIALVAAYALMHGGSPPPRLAAGQRPPPEIRGDVRLQVDPAGDIARFSEEKRRLLEGYAWIDRDQGIARIPVARAMAILAADARAGSAQ